jgi:uncharacterized protein YggE
MKNVFLLLLAAVSLNSFSQIGEKNFIDQNYIEVNGRAELEVVPDLIYLKIVLSDKDNKNKQSLDEIEKSMVGKLTEIGVDVKKDLSVKDFDSNFKKYWISKTDVILTKEFQLIVHDAKVLQSVFFGFQKLGISNVSIDRLDHSRIEQFRREVKVNAVKAAKEKAEALTSSINQTIGKAIFIQELDFSNMYEYKNRMSNMAMKIFSPGAADEVYQPEIEFEKINLQYSILARFELK